MKSIAYTLILLTSAAASASTHASEANDPAPVVQAEQPAPMSSLPSRRYALGYFLPKTVAAVKFAQRIVKCPTKNDQTIEVESRVAIASRTVPDTARFFEIDARAGFLAKRSTDLKLNADGTIASINATVEGQGGPILVSLANAAGMAVKLATRARPGFELAPAAPILECKPAIVALIVERNQTGDEIAALETQLRDTGLSTGQSELLALRHESFAALTDALTLTSGTPVKFDQGSARGTARIDPVGYQNWFETPDHALVAMLPGASGLETQWTADKAASAAFTAAGTAVYPGKPSPGLFYRRPVPVTIEVKACKALTGACEEDPRPLAAALSDDAVVGVPQLSGLFELNIGRGGLFGSRELNAEFGPSGAPLRLQYGSSPGASDIASVIDASAAAAQSARGAKQDALDRKLALLKTRKEIRELEDELANAATQ